METLAFVISLFVMSYVSYFFGGLIKPAFIYFKNFHDLTSTVVFISAIVSFLISAISAFIYLYMLLGIFGLLDNGVKIERSTSTKNS